MRRFPFYDWKANRHIFKTGAHKNLFINGVFHWCCKLTLQVKKGERQMVNGKWLIKNIKQVERIGG
jgi:hypothetical protein